MDELPDTPEAKTIVVGVEDCLRTPPILQPRDPSLTGVWEDEKHERVSVAINHAGFYIAIWISKLSSREATHFLGRGVTPSFAIYEPGKFDTSVGSVQLDPKVKGGLRLDLRPAGWGVYRLVQINRKVTLSDRALAYFGKGEEGELVRRLEHAPLSTVVLRDTEEILTGPRMMELLDEFFSAPVSWRDRAEILAAAKHIDEHVQDLGILAGHPSDGRTGGKRGGPWRPADPHSRPILMRHAHALLNVTPCTITIRSTLFSDVVGASGLETTKTVFERLVDVVATIHDPRLEPVLPLPGLARLGIPAPDEAPRFVYEFKVHAEGIAGSVGVGISAFRGTVRIRQIEPTEQADPFVLHFFMGGGAGGLSGGIRTGFEAEGVGRSHTAWAKEELLGRFSVYEHVAGGAVIVGRSNGFTQWLIRGTGGKPPMSVNFGIAKTHGIEAGAEFSGAEGYITLDEDDAGFTENFVPVDINEDYVTKYNADTDVHFELGSATLSQDGRDIVGWLGATELAALRNPLSTMRFIGSADRVDVRWFNMALSNTRAGNALQVLRDAAASDFKASAEAYGLGEGLAASLGEPDRKENPEFRRVWVELNGHTVATLRGAESGER